MFTGIIETLGIVVSSKKENGNLRLNISAPFANELKKGDSIAHNGVCLTVEKVLKKEYSVTLVEETLKRSNLSLLKKGNAVNLERAMLANARLDGHFVQGHVDCIAKCFSVRLKNGSTIFSFSYDKKSAGLLVEKGSVSVNGVSLTIAGIDELYFSVAVIPFTLAHTNFKSLKEGDTVNIEFDILGKYAAKQIASMQLKMFAEN